MIVVPSLQGCCVRQGWTLKEWIVHNCMHGQRKGEKKEREKKKKRTKRKIKEGRKEGVNPRERKIKIKEEESPTSFPISPSRFLYMSVSDSLPRMVQSGPS